MANYKTESTSKNSADVKDIPLDDNPGSTRRVCRAKIINNPNNPDHNVKLTLVHQRKKGSDEWNDIKAIKLNTLKGGEGVKFALRSHQTNKLFKALKDLYEIAGEGVPQGEKQLTVAEAAKVIEVDKDRRVFVEQLLKKEYGKEIWKELLEQDPDLGTKLANARVQQNRINSLNVFSEGLNNPESYNEQWWQSFFEENEWIFGYGLNYQFLHLLNEQANYGGANYTGKGSQKGDFLMNTSANVKFTVLVEIKKPNTSLFNFDQSGKPKKHRNGASLLNDELTGGVSQLQANCYRWDTEGSERREDLEELLSKNVFTYQPKGILVIGHTNQLNDPQARSTFELFRRNTDNPEIITFDELYERAKFIVNQNEEQKVDDLPF
jgi:hypothetical protein